MRNARRHGMKKRKGAMVVFIAFLMMLFMVTAVFSVDVAYVQLTRTELRAATDAAARAGAEALGRLQSVDDAKTAAINAAAENVVAGEALLVGDGDIEFGTSEQDPSGGWTFDPNGSPVNAVRVTGNRTQGSLSGPVGLFFARVLGRQTFEPKLSAVAAHLDREIVIVMDRSGSMAWDLSGTDWSYPPWSPPETHPYYLPPHDTLSRWAAAENAVDVFLAELALTQTEEKVGLVTYSHEFSGNGISANTVDLNAQLSTSFATVSGAMKGVGDNAIPGGTNISAGIDVAATELTGPNARPLAAKTMIVLTDGVWNQGRDPIEAATDAAAQGITIHSITFSDGADEVTMGQVATIGGGVHYHAPDAATLSEVFRTIAKTLPVAVIH